MKNIFRGNVRKGGGGGVPPKSVTPSFPKIFVRKFLAFFEEFFWVEVLKWGEGGNPQICIFFGKIFVRKGVGGTPLTDKNRKVVFDVLPYNVSYMPGISAIL